MEGKRVMIDGAHEHRRSKVFALMVIVGVIIVAIVWYTQLHTMVRGARLSELGEDFAVFEESFQENFGNDEANKTAEAILIQNAVKGVIGDKMTEEQAKNTVADKAVEELRTPSDTTVNENEESIPESEATVAE